MRADKLILAACLCILAAGLILDHAQRAPECTTDTECARKCAADEADCDGGPQS